MSSIFDDECIMSFQRKKKRVYYVALRGYCIKQTEYSHSECSIELSIRAFCIGSEKFADMLNINIPRLC